MTFSDLVAKTLRDHAYLVMHQRPARMADGSWRTAIEYDGAGFPDITALRPGAPAIFLELKEGAGRPSPNQRDWQCAGIGEGRFCAVLRPEGLAVFRRQLDVIDTHHPVLDGWPAQLRARQFRNETEKTRRKVLASIRNVTAPTTPSGTEFRDGVPSHFTVGAGKLVYTYRGHGTHDESVCGYGPVVWHPEKGKYIAAPRAKFRCWPAGTKIKAVR